MPLRTPNDPNYGAPLLTDLGTILIGSPAINTVLGAVPASAATGKGPVYVQREYDLYRGNFPALLLSAGPQTYSRSSRSTWQGTFTAYADYYDRWDEQGAEMDDIRVAIDLDLERMKANIESNESLQIGVSARTISMYQTMLSPYEGMIKAIAGMTYIYRRLTLSFHKLPYDS